MNICFRRALFLVSFLLIGGSYTNAQTFIKSSAPADSSVKAKTAAPARVVKPKVKRPKPISKELSGGLRVNTDGWSLFMERGVVKSEDRQSDFFYNLRYTQIEFSEKKHAKETRTTNPGGGAESPKSYIFGKVNNFYTFKIGYGNRKMIAGKPDPGTVSIHWIYNGGLSLGMLKPYYLNVSSGEEIKYTDASKDEFLTGYNIIGSAGVLKGIGEMKYIPGLQFRTGLHFDFANRERKKSKLAIETGIAAEVYTQKIELMANQTATPYFVNLYLSFQFGRRWE